MTSSRQQEQQRLLTILYQALAEPVGLVLASNNPTKARQRLYAVRRAAGDGSLDQLRIALSPQRSNQLLVLRADATLPEDLTEEPDSPPSLEEIGL